MTRLALLVLLLASVCAFGQTAPIGKSAPVSITSPVPLKCGKWEHPVAGTRTCASSARIHTDAEADKECPWTQIIECAPDMHEVTEKEWQALMERLKALEPANEGNKSVRIGNQLIFEVGDDYLCNYQPYGNGDIIVICESPENHKIRMMREKMDAKPVAGKE